MTIRNKTYRLICKNAKSIAIASCVTSNHAAKIRSAHYGLRMSGN